jgi:hypothetical protein
LAQRRDEAGNSGAHGTEAGGGCDTATVADATDQDPIVSDGTCIVETAG